MTQNWTIMSYSAAAAAAAAAVAPTVYTFKYNETSKPDILNTYSNLPVYSI